MATFNAAQRRSLAKSGAAEANGSFPIRNASDLSNAIRDFGRAGSDPADKAHIVARARALGLSAKLPMSWMAGGKK
jgi:hypothetical protein